MGEEDLLPGRGAMPGPGGAGSCLSRCPFCCVDQPPQCLIVLGLPFEVSEGTGEGFQGHVGVGGGILSAICVKCILDVTEAAVGTFFPRPLELKLGCCSD